MDCVRISSIIVRRDLDNMVEIGWVENPLGIHPRASCNASTFRGYPHGLFLVEVNGMQTCRNMDSNAYGRDQWADFRVQNTDADEWWTYYVNGNQKAHIDAGFITANIVRANGERHGTWDTAWSDFKGLHYLSLGNNWYRWSNSWQDAAVSDDPHFRPCKVSGDDADIVVQREAC